jgi:hypothetical protein
VNERDRIPRQRDWRVMARISTSPSEIGAGAPIEETMETPDEILEQAAGARAGSRS